MEATLYYLEELFTVKKYSFVTAIIRVWGIALWLSYQTRKFLLPQASEVPAATLPVHSVLPEKLAPCHTVGYDSRIFPYILPYKNNV